MNNWSPPQRPAVYAVQALVTAIIDHTYPPGSTLPAERELAAQLGVTRPTLREALRKLESDGWLEVQQGKPTRVKDFWREGGLNVLSSLVHYGTELPPDFIPNLLEVRLAMAPAYARAAIEHDPHEVSACLSQAANLPDTPEDFASFDWRLHSTLTISSGNPIYTLILNGFSGFYEEMARLYFAGQEARQASRDYYRDLLRAADQGDASEAEHITCSVMQASIDLWKRLEREGER